MNARFPYLFALALTLPLASCRFVGMKPDFSVMGDAFTPVESDSVVVESKPGASTPLAGYTPRPASPAPAAKPAAPPTSGSQSPSLFSQQQPAALSQNQPTQSAAAQVKLYTVQPGDSLSRIARMHKVPLGSLAGTNGIDLQKPLIKPGQQLRIPQGGAAISAPPRSAAVPPPNAAAAAPLPATTQQPASAPQPTPPATTQPAPAPLLTLKPATPAATPAPAPAATPAPAPTPAVKPAATPTPAPAGTYRVCAGDTLYRIARQHGISLQELMQANKLTEESARSVRVGTLLTIPAHP